MDGECAICKSSAATHFSGPELACSFSMEPVTIHAPMEIHSFFIMIPARSIARRTASIFNRTNLSRNKQCQCVKPGISLYSSGGEWEWGKLALSGLMAVELLTKEGQMDPPVSERVWKRKVIESAAVKSKCANATFSTSFCHLSTTRLSILNWMGYQFRIIFIPTQAVPTALWTVCADLHENRHVLIKRCRVCLAYDSQLELESYFNKMTIGN